MRAITHLVFFALAPTATGGLSDTDGNITPNIAAVRTAAHNAGKNVEIAIGGGGTITNFRAAISPTYRATFISNIVNWVSANDYDGVDIDMEPLESTDATDFENFIWELRDALDDVDPGLEISAAAEPVGVPSIFAAVYDTIDQINIMTYDLSGNWPGWISWHNSNVYNNGQTFPTGGQLPSTDLCVQAYTTAGIPLSRLGIGSAFYGAKWNDVTGPQQAINAASGPTTAVTYNDIVTTYAGGTYHFDSAVDAAWLGFQTTTPVQFISFDDPRVVVGKVNYVKNKGLGGLMCFNIAQQYVPTAPAGQQQPLLAAIYDGLHPTTTVDSLNNWSLVSSKSANWTLDTTNPSYMNGDASRATRTTDTTEYLVYSYPNITKFTAKVYAWNGPISAASFFVSSDNGATYSAVSVTPGSKTISTSPWGYYNIVNANPLPAGITNLKVQFSTSGNNWDPQLSQISITHT